MMNQIIILCVIENSPAPHTVHLRYVFIQFDKIFMDGFINLLSCSHTVLISVPYCMTK